jgi:serine/threonine protein kinase
MRIPVPDACTCAGFVAPEVVNGGVHTPAMDNFALGIILYMMITGQRPMTKDEANDLTYATFEADAYPQMQVRSSIACMLCRHGPDRDLTHSRGPEYIVHGFGNFRSRNIIFWLYGPNNCMLFRTISGGS